MELILARHGNTFEAGETPRWVGAREDLPLTGDGCKQAEEVALWLRSSGITPVIYAGPLRRTRDFAEIVRAALDIESPPVIDERLAEIDYGNWSNLSDEEIRARFGEDELSGWSALSRWPAGAGWQPDEETVAAEVRDFAHELRRRHPADPVLAVSSNGRLRYFLTLIPGEFEQRSAAGAVKMRTGNVSLLTEHDGNFEVRRWNATPAELKRAGFLETPDVS